MNEESLECETKWVMLFPHLPFQHLSFTFITLLWAVPQFFPHCERPTLSPDSDIITEFPRLIIKSSWPGELHTDTLFLE